MDKEAVNILISILGFGGTITALAFGLRQYKRSEQWKRGEFVAKEIKEFEANPAARNAMLLIDWGTRKINLNLISNPAESDYIRITREDQWRALIPHTIKLEYPSSSYDVEMKAHGQNEPKRRFTFTEAKIRDTYDAFLDYLERFATFIESGLVSSKEFRPYLIYWMDSIAGIEDVDVDEGDVEWKCALLAYINFYRYSGVKFLFKEYGWDIDFDGETYVRLKELTKNKKLHEDLIDSVKRKGVLSPFQRGGSAASRLS